MSNHNICFHGEIRKILYRYPSYLELYERCKWNWNRSTSLIERGVSAVFDA